MRNNLLALMAALALAFCEPMTALAQFFYQPGTFGYRVLGQSLAPAPSTFGGGIQTNAAGAFLFIGRPNGADSFTMPWRPPYQSFVDQPIAAIPPSQFSLPPQQPVGGVQGVAPPATALTPRVQVAPPSQLLPSGYNGPVSSSEQGAGTTSGPAAAGAAWNYTLAGSANRATATRPEPYVRSPELSDRLTRIARFRGMLSGSGIDVYLSGDVALVQGVVRTAANRTVLGNVLGLEPDVSRIDNRLAVQGHSSRPSNVSTGNVRRSSQGYQAKVTPAYGP
jgi:hypothetical protein